MRVLQPAGLRVDTSWRGLAARAVCGRPPVHQSRVIAWRIVKSPPVIRLRQRSPQLQWTQSPANLPGACRILLPARPTLSEKAKKNTVDPRYFFLEEWGGKPAERATPAPRLES